MGLRATCACARVSASAHGFIPPVGPLSVASAPQALERLPDQLPHLTRETKQHDILTRACKHTPSFCRRVSVQTESAPSVLRAEPAHSVCALRAPALPVAVPLSPRPFPSPDRRLTVGPGERARREGQRDGLCVQTESVCSGQPSRLTLARVERLSLCRAARGARAAASQPRIRLSHESAVPQASSLGPAQVAALLASLAVTTGTLCMSEVGQESDREVLFFEVRQHSAETCLGLQMAISS